MIYDYLIWWYGLKTFNKMNTFLDDLKINDVKLIDSL
jgi:hypothetical protein